MKKMIVIAIAILTFGSLAKADGIKPDDDGNRVSKLSKPEREARLKQKKVKKHKGTYLNTHNVVSASASSASSPVPSDSLSTRQGSGLQGQDDNRNPLANVPEPGTLLLTATALLIVASALRARSRFPL